MTDIFLSPVSHIIEIGLAISGIAILLFAVRAFRSPDAWGEGAEYEMLGLEKPATEEARTHRPAAKAGDIGTEDRIVRIGSSISLTYLMITWFGIGSVAMWALILPILYFTVTAVVGVDPLYKKLGLTTQLR